MITLAVMDGKEATALFYNPSVMIFRVDEKKQRWIVNNFFEYYVETDSHEFRVDEFSKWSAVLELKTYDEKNVATYVLRKGKDDSVKLKVVQDEKQDDEPKPV